MSNYINPNRNESENTDRIRYGQVIRVPKLPEANAVFDGIAVFNSFDDIFYRCKRVETDTESGYKWVAITGKATRPYIMPVGKLTEDDKTEKSTTAAILKTIHEIQYGFIRYGINFGMLGYTELTGAAVGGTPYYTFKTNDNVDAITWLSPGDELTRRAVDLDGDENPDVYVITSKLNKSFTGEMQEAVVGEDYVLNEIPSHKLYTKTNLDSLTLVEMRDAVNEIVTRLITDAGAPISTILPSEDDNLTWDMLCSTLNEIVDEVNPFSIPWQVLINRIWHIESHVGPARMQPSDEDERARVIMLGDWKDEIGDWDNVSDEVKEAIRFCTVCQVTDSTLKVLQSINVTIGDIKSLYNAGNEVLDINGTNLSDGGTTLIEYLLALRQATMSYTDAILASMEGVKQLRQALGENIGYVGYTADDATTKFNASEAYYIWDDAHAHYKQLTPSAADSIDNYVIGHTIKDWIQYVGATAVPPVDTVYVFDRQQTAGARIAALDELIGPVPDAEDHGFGKYYLETKSVQCDGPFYQCQWSDQPSDLDQKGSADGVAARKKVQFVEIEVDKTGISTAAQWEALYKSLVAEYGPIYVQANVHNILQALKLNNREIAAVQRESKQTDAVHEQRMTDIETEAARIDADQKMRSDRLKLLAGFQDEADDPEKQGKPVSWHVDGYKQMYCPAYTDPRGAHAEFGQTEVFDPDVHYFGIYEINGIEITDITSVEDLNALLGRYKPYDPESFQADKPLHYRYLVPGTAEEVAQVNPDYRVGASIKTWSTAHSNAKVFEINSSSLYFETNDTEFVSGKTYYVENGAAYEALKGIADYELSSYRVTKDETFADPDEKIYYRYSINAGKFIRATYGDTVDDYINRKCDYYRPHYAMTTDDVFEADKTYYVEDEEHPGEYIVATGYVPGDPIPHDKEYFEFLKMTIPSGTEYYEYYESLIKNCPLAGCGNVWTRDVDREDFNHHRGLIDRNTADLERQRRECRAFKRNTEQQIDSIKNLMLYLTISALQEITQEMATFSLMWQTITKLITVSNIIERLSGVQTWKHADGIYDSGADYFRVNTSNPDCFHLTADESAVPGKYYYVWKLIPGTTPPRYSYQEVRLAAGTPITPADELYEPKDGYILPIYAGEDYEIGLDVGSGVYTKDIVIPTIENYTMKEIRLAINRVLRVHLSDQELADYTEIPGDHKIEPEYIYYRQVDGEWEKIVPLERDPAMIGQEIRVYDPEHHWYIVVDEIADDNYTMTWMRVMLNELIKLYNRGVEATKAIDRWKGLF